MLTMVSSIITQKVLFFLCAAYIFQVTCDDSYISHEYSVPCYEKYIPENCNYPNISLDAIRAVVDLDRCGPAVLDIEARNLYWAGVGRKFTYRRNFKSFERIMIIPKILEDTLRNTTSTKLLGYDVAMPIGISPTAAHKMAHPDGEIASAKAAASHGALYALSLFTQTKLEDVAAAAFSVNKQALLWIHIYPFFNRQSLRKYLRRAENAGYKAVLVTIGHPMAPTISCNASAIYRNWEYADLNFSGLKLVSTSEDLVWIVRNTKLPVVAKGIMTAEAALTAARTGVKGIFISNQGGRLVDGQKSTVEVLPSIVRAMKLRYPDVEIYIDSGIRSGSDVFKALALGAKAAFVGRPVIWGLAIGGERGASKMLKIIKQEFGETMLMSGYEKPSDIDKGAVSLPPENFGWN